MRYLKYSSRLQSTHCEYIKINYNCFKFNVYFYGYLLTVSSFDTTLIGTYAQLENQINLQALSQVSAYYHSTDIIRHCIICAEDAKLYVHCIGTSIITLFSYNSDDLFQQPQLKLLSITIFAETRHWIQTKKLLVKNYPMYLFRFDCYCE